MHRVIVLFCIIPLNQLINTITFKRYYLHICGGNKERKKKKSSREKVGEIVDRPFTIRFTQKKNTIMK